MTVLEIVKKEIDKARSDLLTTYCQLDESFDGHELIKAYNALVKINKIIKGVNENE
jgi:hypothetical protein